MPFLPQEIIRRKRDRGKLSRADIQAIVNGMVEGTVVPAQVGAFAMAVFLNGMDAEEAVALTLAMRDSGERLAWPGLDGPVVDKHSTGGIGDNVSLLLAPMLAACGCHVPMISGRGLGHSGGTLDKLEAIPGYAVLPGRERFAEVVRDVGCAIVGQSADLAPADGLLYAVRDATATVESLPLIVASILSKKLAAGLGALVLDVKTGNGAFMAEPARSRELAQAMVSVGNGAGVTTAALVTDMNEPLASAAGNAVEVRNALAVLTGAVQEPRLLEVTLALGEILLGLAGVEGGRARLQQSLDSGAAAERFARMAAALGGPADLIARLDAHLPAAPVIRDVTADAEGVVAGIDLRTVGLTVTVLGGGRARPGDAIDPSVGFDRLLGLGAAVTAGSSLGRIHARSPDDAALGAARLRAAYRIGDAAPRHPLILDRIPPEGF